MMSRQAHALDTLQAEINKHAPKRSKASDGGIASAAHHKQNPTSDHDPNKAGVWRARDFTHDPKNGLDCNQLATLLIRKMTSGHPALKAGAYIIWNGRIYSYNRRAEGWRPYTGSNAHRHHLHVSVATAAAGYDNRTPWSLWAVSTPNLDHAIADLTKAINHRPAADPVRGDLVIARQHVITARKRAKGTL